MATPAPRQKKRARRDARIEIRLRHKTTLPNPGLKTAGPPETAAPGPPSRWWPRSWAKPAVGDGYPDQDHARPGPVAGSTGDTTGWERSMPAFRSVVSVLLRALGDFSLHPRRRVPGCLDGPCGARHYDHMWSLPAPFAVVPGFRRCGCCGGVLRRRSLTELASTQACSSAGIAHDLPLCAQEVGDGGANSDPRPDELARAPAGACQRGSW